MRTGFVEHVTRVLGTLPPGFLPVRLTSFVSVKATRCVDTEDEPPARAEDIDSVTEAMVAQMKEQEQKEQELKELLPYQRPPYLRETNGVSLYLKPEYQRPLYLKLRSQTMSSLALVACSVSGCSFIVAAIVVWINLHCAPDAATPGFAEERGAPDAYWGKCPSESTCLF